MRNELRVPADRLQIAVVGIGRWGRNLVRVFRAVDRCRVRALCDVEASRLATFARGDGDAPRLCEDYADLLADPALDAVVIATPPASHAGLTLAAIEAGKHVFVEKPMALSTRDAARVRAESKRCGLQVMVGHVLRFHPGVLALSELTESGHLGQVRTIVAERVGPLTGKFDGDPWWSLAPHDVSLIRHLFGADPIDVAVTALSSSDAAAGVVAELRFRGERRATIRISSSSSERHRRVTLVGTRAVAVLEDRVDAPSLWVSDPGNAACWSRLSTAPAEPLLLEAEHFVDSLLSGSPVRTDADEGHAVVRALEAGHASLRAGGIPRFATLGVPLGVRLRPEAE